MRTKFATVVALCLSATLAAAQDHHPAPAAGPDAGRTDSRAAAAVPGGSGKTAPPVAKKPHAVIDLPISESERREADARRNVRQAVNKKTAAGAHTAKEQATAEPARVPVEELAVRLQRILDAEGTRRASTTAPAAQSAGGRATAPGQPRRKPSRPAARPARGVVLDWGPAPLARGVRLAWHAEPEGAGPTRGTIGARLSWEPDRP